MPIYSLSLASTSLQIEENVPMIELYSNATKQVRLLELCITVSSPNGPAYSRIAFGRPGVVGTPSATTTFLAENPDDPASLSTAAVAWTTAPRPASTWNRIMGGQGTLGEEYGPFSFPRGFAIPAGGSVVVWVTDIWTGNAGLSTNIWAVIDE